MPPFRPEPEQLAAMSRWLGAPDVVRELALLMPLAGGPRSACERRILDVAAALAVMSTTSSYAQYMASIELDELLRGGI